MPQVNIMIGLARGGLDKMMSDKFDETRDAQTPKIAIVEDDPRVRRSLQMLLIAHGYAVRSYASGRSFLDDQSARDAICLVADYAMPDMNGLDLIRSLRALGWQCPAVMITAYHSTDLVRTAQAEGYSAVIEKPLREHELVRTLDRLLAT